MASGLADRKIAEKKADRDDAWFERVSLFSVSSLTTAALDAG